MGMNIDLYSYDAEKLINEICEQRKTEDKELVKKILDEFGTFIADKYVLLNQELWKEDSCYYNVMYVLKAVFPNENEYINNIFEKNREELINAVGRYEAMERLFGDEWQKRYNFY